MDIWVLHVARGYDYEHDFAGVFTTVDADTLKRVGHKNIAWRFADDAIYGHNMAWETNAAEFIFEKQQPNTYLPPIKYQ